MVSEELVHGQWAWLLLGSRGMGLEEQKMLLFIINYFLVDSFNLMHVLLWYDFEIHK